MALLNRWVRDLRERLGASAIVPWFDPADAGQAARILWLLEASGPRATHERGGSGIVSCNNNDGTAENAWRTRTEGGVSRRLVAHWNVIPYYLGSETKIRSWGVSNVTEAGPLLEELLRLLPAVEVVILGGGAAQRAWRHHRPEQVDAVTVECPHASPRNINTRPDSRERIVQAWRRALAATQ